MHPLPDAPPGTMRIESLGGASEVRSIESPAFAVTPTMLDQMWGYGPTRSGVQINEQTALTFTAVYAAIKIISETIAMLPLKVMEGHPDDRGRKPAIKNPIYKLLRMSPNGDMTAADFKETLQAHILGWGNGYSRIVFGSDGQPKAFLPLLPDRTHPERHGGKLKYYDSSGGGVFWPEEILHFKAFGFNGLKGYSPIAMQREALAAGKAAEMFGATFWGNGARVTNVLESASQLNAMQIAQVREQWEQMHAGLANANRTAVLPKGLTLKQISINPDDAQFLETQKFNVLTVARIYRIPPHMLAELDRATHSNIEQAGIEFLVYTISPWISKWEEEIDRKVFYSGGYFCRFDERRLMRADMAARQQFYSAGRQWSYLTANDIRDYEQMDPLPENGDMPLYPLNMGPLDQLGMAPLAPPKGAGRDAILDYLIQRGLLSPEGERAVLGETEPGRRSASPGGATRTDASGGENIIPGEESRAAGIMRPVLADAIGRMLRKEANAIGRMTREGSQQADPAKAEAFYNEHREHVIQSIRTPSMAFAQLAYREANGNLNPILEKLAETRHGFLSDQQIESESARAAEALIAEILQTSQPKN